MTHELKTGGDRGYLRIATEEAFATQEQIDVFLRMVRDGTADQGMVSLWGFYATSPSTRATQIMDRLLDLDEQRLRHMDETGIDKAILALTSPWRAADSGHQGSEGNCSAAPMTILQNAVRCIPTVSSG